MCYFHKPYHKEIQTAKKDIVVYKIVNESELNKHGFNSHYRGFKYKFGETYSLKKSDKFGEPHKFKIDQLAIGFHSYKKAIYEKTTVAIGLRWMRGFKSKLCEQTSRYPWGVIIECVIPKGAKYFHNGTDYISDTIKPICIIMPPKSYLDDFWMEDFNDLIKEHYNVF